MAGKGGTGSQKLLHSGKKKKNIKVTNLVILKDTLKMKSTAAFWINYFISLLKLYQPESSVLCG